MTAVLAPPRPASFTWYAGRRKSVAPFPDSQAQPRRDASGLGVSRLARPAFSNLTRAPFSICGRWLYHNRKTGATACFNCKSWRCQGCGPVKKKNWVASITHRLQAWDRVRFWTLTLNPKLVPEGVPPEKWLQRGWRNLRAELGQRCPRCCGRMKRGACRKHPTAQARPPSFVWVLEYTKNEVPHLHVAVDQYVPRGWIQKHWVRLTGAWNVDVRAVDAENVTTYLAKYLGKTLDTLQTMKRSKGEALAIKGLHVYGTSPDMVPFAPHAPNPEWELIKVEEDIAALLTPDLVKLLAPPLMPPGGGRPPGVGPPRARQSERSEEGRPVGGRVRG